MPSHAVGSRASAAVTYRRASAVPPAPCGAIRSWLRSSALTAGSVTAFACGVGVRPDLPVLAAPACLQPRASCTPKKCRATCCSSCWQRLRTLRGGPSARPSSQCRHTSQTSRCGGFGPGQAGQAADLFVSPPASTSRGLTCRPDTLQRRLCRLLLTVCWAGVLACVPRCVLQREATIMAGRIAGLEKIRIIR